MDRALCFLISTVTVDSARSGSLTAARRIRQYLVFAVITVLFTHHNYSKHTATSSRVSASARVLQLIYFSSFLVSPSLTWLRLMKQKRSAVSQTYHSADLFFFFMSSHGKLTQNRYLAQFPNPSLCRHTLPLLAHLSLCLCVCVYVACVCIHLFVCSTE